MAKEPIIKIMEACEQLEQVKKHLEELKKKYIGEDTNVPTKETEGENNG